MDILKKLGDLGLTVLSQLGPIGATVATIVDAFTGDDTPINGDTELTSLATVMDKLPPDVAARVIGLLTEAEIAQTKLQTETVVQHGQTTRMTEAEITQRLKLYLDNDNYSKIRPRAYIACVCGIIFVSIGYFLLMVLKVVMPEIILPSWQDVAVVVTPMALIAERYQSHREKGKMTKASIINGTSESVEKVGNLINMGAKIASVVGVGRR